MAERASVETARDVEDDASGVLRARGCPLSPCRVGRRRERIGGVLARAARREHGQGEAHRFDALHGSGEDLTRVVFPARTSITY